MQCRGIQCAVQQGELEVGYEASHSVLLINLRLRMLLYWLRLVNDSKYSSFWYGLVTSHSCSAHSSGRFLAYLTGVCMNFKIVAASIVCFARRSSVYWELHCGVVWCGVWCVVSSLLQPTIVVKFSPTCVGCTAACGRVQKEVGRVPHVYRSLQDVYRSLWDVYRSLWVCTAACGAYISNAGFWLVYKRVLLSMV